MERIGTDHRKIKFKEVVQVTHIVVVVDEFIEGDTETPEGTWIENELILSSNRRPLPIPYSEEP